MHGYTRQVKVENHYSASLSPTLDLALTSITGNTMPRSFDAYLQSRSRHKSMIFYNICLQNSHRIVFAAKKITTHLYQKFLFFCFFVSFVFCWFFFCVVVFFCFL